MSATYGFGFVVILFLYFSIGMMAVAGSILLTQKFLRPKWEQVYYAGFLLPIASFYLAFADYFGANGAWGLETRAVWVFAGFALVGVRAPLLLALGYLLHGVWDGLHELQAHGGYAAFADGTSTPTPLGYGVFCAAFDIGVFAYALLRRRAWTADWKATN